MSPFSGLVRSTPRHSSLRPDDAPARTTHSYGPSVGLGQGTRHRDDSLLVPAIRDSKEVARKLQQQPLLLRQHERTGPAHALEEVADVGIQGLSNLVQAPRRSGALLKGGDPSIAWTPLHTNRAAGVAATRNSDKSERAYAFGFR